MLQDAQAWARRLEPRIDPSGNSLIPRQSSAATWMFSPLGDPSVVGKAPFARPRSVRLIRAKSQGAPQHPLRRHLMSHISCNSLQGGQISGSYHSNLSFSPTVKLNQSPAAHWTFCPPAAL